MAFTNTAQNRKQPTGQTWRMDETYFKVEGTSAYYYRTIDKFGKFLDFMFSEHRDEAVVTAFTKRATNKNGFPDKIVIDKSGVNFAGLQNMDRALILHGWFWLIEILQIKHLNNIVEQNHRFIRNLTKRMKGIIFFTSSAVTLEGIEVARMIRKNQACKTGKTRFQWRRRISRQYRRQVGIAKRCFYTCPRCLSIRIGSS